jgi:SAM-dependent methyltransferase
VTTTASPTSPDQSRVDQFAEKLLGILNGGGLALMISLGHRTGLFDMMAGRPPAGSQEIATVAGLEERYVREWLGAMVTGGIVVFDPAERTYQLPAEHAALLTSAATPNNMASVMQWISVLGHVEDQVLERFRSGGGVPYECFHRFHEVMADESGQTVVAVLIDAILPLVPGLTGRLTEGIDVLDVGCGSGRALCLMAEHFPRSRFTGYDLCDEAVLSARAEAQSRGLTNVRFERKDVAGMDEPSRFDLVTAFDIVHDQARPADVLAGIRRALKSTGTFLMQDIRASSHLERNMDHLLGPFLYTISTMHCMTVSLAQGGAGLGTAWGTELALQMLREAGFADVTVSELPHDILNNYYVAR